MSVPEPNWVPLERLAEVAAAAGQAVDPDDFMWMGSGASATGERIELYKHYATRRYLNVDAGGHAYRFTGDGYEPLRSPEPAIVAAYDRGLAYVCWTNLDASFMRPYEPGDRLVRGWSDVIEVAGPASAVRSDALAEQVWMRHNRDDRPDGQLCPSISVGDVVVFGDVALSVDSCGFARVNLDATDLITDRNWRHVRDEPRSAPAGRDPVASNPETILADWSNAAVVDPSTSPSIGLDR